MKASEEFPIFFLLVSIDFRNRKYRINPSDIIIRPIIINGISAILQKSLSIRCPIVDPATRKYKPVLIYASKVVSFANLVRSIARYSRKTRSLFITPMLSFNSCSPKVVLIFSIFQK
jgi:hypothetical protein